MLSTISSSGPIVVKECLGSISLAPPSQFNKSPFSICVSGPPLRGQASPALKQPLHYCALMRLSNLPTVCICCIDTACFGPEYCSDLSSHSWRSLLRNIIGNPVPVLQPFPLSSCEIIQRSRHEPFEEAAGRNIRSAIDQHIL